MMSPANEEVRKRCVQNWLRIRRDWCYILDMDTHRTLFSAGNWRNFLHNPPTGTKILDKVKEVWGVTVYDVSRHTPMWYGDQVDNIGIDETLCKAVSFELSRLGFRLDLLTVDSIIVRRSGRGAQDMAAQRLQWINKILGNSLKADISSRPTADIALTAANVHDRIDSLEAFRRIMENWPNKPEDIGDIQVPLEGMGVTELRSIERAIARFYIKTFVRHAGRAPVLPLYIA